MNSGVCRGVVQRLQAAASAPAASCGGWSRIMSRCCRAQTEPRCESRRGASGRGTMNVFNRDMKRRQKNWAAQLEDGHHYDYLRDEVHLTQTWFHY